MIFDDAAPVFVGRSRELAFLASCLDDAAAGRPRAVVVQSAAGMGKTALIETFLARNPGVPVFRGSGARWETALGYGVLRQILRGTPEVPGDDQTAAGQLLELLPGKGGPTLLVVDNLQWVDEPTLHVLLAAVRRMHTEKVLVILALTDEEEFRLPAGSRSFLEDKAASLLRLGPLSAEEITALALGAGGLDLPGPAAHQLAGHTGGNPRQIEQLLRENEPGLWNRWRPLLPAPKSLVRETAARLGGLHGETRQLIEAAAVLGQRGALVDAAAIAGVPDPALALDEACSSGFFRVFGHGGSLTVAFPGPLLRAAVYETLPQQRRILLHRAAAEVVPDEGAALGHRAAASLLPDQSLADELEAFAAAQSERGAWSAAADALVRSGHLHPTRAGRETRLLWAIDAMVGAGELPRALSYADEIESFARSALRDAVSGYLAILQGRRERAGSLLDSAWNVCNPASDGPTAAMIAQRRVLDALARLHGPDLLMWAERAQALAPADSPAAVESHAIAGLGLGFTGRPADAERSYLLLGERKDLGAQKQRVQMGKGWLHLALDRPGTAVEELSGAVSTDFSNGSFRISLWAQGWLARAEFATGAWDEALRTVDRASELQERVGLDLVRPLVHWTATQIHALRGNWGRAEYHLQRSAATAENYPIMVLPSALARAHTAEARADYEGVLLALDPLLRLDRAHGMDEPGFWAWQDIYANALVMTDRNREASDFLRPLEELAAARRHCSTLARLGYVRGRILGAEGDIDAAKVVFEAGLRRLESLNLPFDRARVEFAYGQTLRRAGKRREAAVPLTAARSFFAGVGAATYVERCERELQASGMNMTRRSEMDFSSLTAQEKAVAVLVAGGASNKQAAQELYVSVKTIQYHLTRTYAKLGVGSRSELAARYREAAE